MKHTFKLIIVALLLLATSLSGYAQQNFLNKYENKDGVAYVYIGKSMIKMLREKNLSQVSGNVQLDSIIFNKLESIDIYAVEKEDIRKAIKHDIDKAVADSTYQLFLKTTNENQTVSVYSKVIKKKNNDINDLIMDITTDDSMSIIVLKGSFSIKDLENIISEDDKE